MRGLDFIYAVADRNGIPTYALLFLACYIFFRIFTSLDFERMAARITRFLRKQRLFVVDDIHREEVWLNLLRIVVGTIALERSLNILLFELMLDGSQARVIVGIWCATASFAMLIGFLTPFFTCQLFLLNQRVFDLVQGTFTLGSCIQQILLMIFLFAPVGRRLSLDSVVMEFGAWPARIVGRMYGFFGHPTVNRLAVIKFAAFVSFGLLSTYAVYGHFLDANWATGTANILLLTSKLVDGSS